MSFDRVRVDFGQSIRLRVPPMSDPYPRLSLDLVDVTAGPRGTLLAIWCDAVERRELTRPAARRVAAAEATSLHLEVVVQYAPNGELVAQWEIWTTAVMLEYRPLAEGRLLGYSRCSSDVDNVFIYDTDGTVRSSGRLAQGIIDVAVLDNEAMLVAYDRYFTDDLGAVLGLAMYTPNLERMDVGYGSGYLPSQLTVSGDAVQFWDRNSSLIISSERGKPIWPDQTQRFFGPLEPEWVLHSFGAERWALVGSVSSSSISVILGVVEGGLWQSVGELLIDKRSSSNHRGEVVSCNGSTLHYCIGRQWHTLSIDDLFEEWESEQALKP